MWSKALRQANALSATTKRTFNYGTALYGARCSGSSVRSNVPTDAHLLPRVTFRACDANIGAKVGTTSCEFAQNVFWSYWYAWEAGESTFTALSPITEQQYDVSCVSGSVAVCRAADGAEVRFPLSAVRAYSAEQGDHYAATHDRGPVDHSLAASEDASDSTGGTSSDSGGGCDPSHEGVCLDPDSYDYDCERGSGDGPDYTGPVEVVGDDLSATWKIRRAARAGRRRGACGGLRDGFDKLRGGGPSRPVRGRARPARGPAGSGHRSSRRQRGAARRAGHAAHPSRSRQRRYRGGATGRQWAWGQVAADVLGGPPAAKTIAGGAGGRLR
jgi:hypothetical protein